MSQSAALETERKLSLAHLVMLVLLPFACGYFMSYLYRSVNAVVAPNLVEDIGLSASELGLLTAAYLFAFAVFQLPLGILLDRYGPRRVQTALFTCAAVGSALFAVGESAAMLAFARGLIGMGFAGGLMAGFKAVVLWVPDERRALANACVMSFGGLGLFVATVPTELAVQAWGWRGVFVGLTAITLGVAAFIFLAVPEQGGKRAVEPLATQVRQMLRLYSDGVFWRLAPLLALTGGSHIAIQTLWSGPWFRDVAGLDRDGVALHLGVVAIAFLFGILASGVVADWLVRRGIGLLWVMSGFLVIYLASQAVIVAQVNVLNIPVWFVFGMSGQVAVLAYPWMASYYGAALSGRTNTAMNLLLFGAAFAIQYAVGAVIDLYPAGAGGGYDPRGYQTSFGIVLALQVAAFAWFLIRVPKLPSERKR